MTVQTEKKHKRKLIVKRGDIFFADMGEGIGSEQKGVRPVLILQNDVGNRHSPTTIVALITSISKKMNLPIHHQIPKEVSKLPRDSIILLEQLRTIDKNRLIKKISSLRPIDLEDVNYKILISLGITMNSNKR